MLPALDPLGHFLFSLATALLVAKLFGEMAFRLGQSSVLGELLAGTLLGPYVLGWVHLDESFRLLMELGVLLLLVETGLETSLPALLKVGKQAALVALTGVLLPLGFGFGFSWLSHLTSLQALMVGATLTATSIGITARTLQDLGEADTPEGRIILGAAILDDLLGLLLLALLRSLTDPSQPTVPAWVMVTQFLCFGVLTWLLFRFAQPLLSLLDRFRNPTAFTALALVFVFLFALLSQLGGLSVIIGAFLAGLLFNRTRQTGSVHHALQPISHFLTPLFFVGVGAQLNPASLNPLVSANLPQLGFIAGLTTLAILGKLLAGLAARRPTLRRAFIGMGMVPRGEVGLIFAQLGLATHVLSPSLFSALVVTVLLTTFVTPPALTVLQRLPLPQWLAGAYQPPPGLDRP